MKRTVILLAAALAVLSCISDPKPEQFVPPRITGTSSTIEKNSVVLTCEVSGSVRVKDCGFMFGTDEENLDRNACIWSGDGKFTMRLDNLTFNVDYYFSSFIGNGRDEFSSAMKHLKIQQRLPEIELLPVTDRTSERIVGEYVVSENFSGEMIVCGLCWGTEPEPTIETTSKTVDSAKYGKHTTEIRGLSVGQTYHLRAYAINAKGTAYSNEQIFYVPVSFEDQEFHEYMLGIGDTDGDGYLSIEEARSIREISLCSDSINSLSGLEFCTGLTKIDCFGSGGQTGMLSTVNLKPFVNLEHLRFCGNRLSSIDLSENLNLKSIVLKGNLLQTMKLSNQAHLIDMDISDNRMEGLDISTFPSLARVNVANNPLTAISLPPDSTIEELDISQTEFPDLNGIFKKVRALKCLKARGILQNSDKIYILTQLEELDCSGSGISEINLRFNRNLKSLDIRNCTSLSELDVCLNDKLTLLNCTGCDNLKTIFMVETQRIDGINTNLTQGCNKPATASIVYSSRIEDPEFSRFLTETFDRNYDSFVSITEVEDVEEVKIDKTMYSGISSLHGLGMFRNLKKLSIPGQNIQSLDLSDNALLTELNCDSNPLSDINLRKCTKLRMLYCQSTQLQSIDLSGCAELEEAYFYNSRLIELDLSASPNLKVLDCSSCPNLKRIVLDKTCANSVKISKDAQAEIVVTP